MFNAIMIIMVLLSALAIGIWYFRRTSAIDEKEEYDDKYTISYLIEYVKETFSTTLKRNLKDQNLTREEYQRQQRIKQELRNAIRNSAIGDTKAKKFVQASIIGIICGHGRDGEITAENIDKVITFNDPNHMSAKDKFETMLHVYAKKPDKTGHVNGPEALSRLFKEYDLNKPIPGTNNYIVKKEDIDRVYDQVMQTATLSFTDKKEILGQRIFEDLYGLGPIDMLLDMSIDEVEGGVSGLPEGSYEFKSQNIKEAKFSYDSIWIVFSGLTIHLDFLSFGSQEELVRICNNIYRYDAPHVLSRSQGYVVATMKDGSRIVVVRPPFADSYAFLARKFDSTPSIAPEDLFKDKGAEVPIKLIKWLVKGSQNIAITGDQGTGKTTALKSFIRFIREDYTLRVQELTPELNLRYAYPDRNVMSFRETESISSQEGLDLQKKTSGTVNIIGEVATAEAASWIIQTAKVASKMTMFTHHAKTTPDLIVSLRNNMMQVNNYTDDASVDEMIATSLNIDIHLERKRGHRFIGRVTEIIPIRDRSYPVADLAGDTGVMTESDYTKLVDKSHDGHITADELNHASLELMEKANIINENEYRRRRTDRLLFTTRDLMKFNETTQTYEMLAMPSDDMIESMILAMTKEEEADMRKDYAYLKSLIGTYGPDAVDTTARDLGQEG